MVAPSLAPGHGALCAASGRAGKVRRGIALAPRSRRRRPGHRGRGERGPGSGRGAPSAGGLPAARLGVRSWSSSRGATLPGRRRTHARGQPGALAVPFSPPTSPAGNAAPSWGSPWPAGRTGHHRLGLAPSEPASAWRTAAGYADWVGPSGRCGLRAQRFATNLRRCVRPPRAGHFGLRAHGDVTGLAWRSCDTRGWGGPTHACSGRGLDDKRLAVNLKRDFMFDQVAACFPSL
jgi:hypothetical protein